MTDPIHRKLEDLLKQFDLYYDRRRGYYRDQRKPIRKILGVTALAQALISVLLQRPDDARARPGDYFKDDDAYNFIFGEDVYPLPVHVGCVRLLRVVEAFIDNEDIDRGDAKNIKFYVLWLLSVMLAQDIAPTTTLHLLRDPETIDPQMIKACFKLAVKRYEQLAVHSDRDIVAKGPELLKALRTDIKRRLPKKKAKKGRPEKIIPEATLMSSLATMRLMSPQMTRHAVDEATGLQPLRRPSPPSPMCQRICFFASSISHKWKSPPLNKTNPVNTMEKSALPSPFTSPEMMVLPLLNDSLSSPRAPLKGFKPMKLKSGSPAALPLASIAERSMMSPVLQ
jgi:AIPR protein